MPGFEGIGPQDREPMTGKAGAGQLAEAKAADVEGHWV